MTISPAFLDEIRARVPLSDIVGRRMKLQRAGREWKAPCPFHAEKTPSFYVNDQKAFFHCFGCGAHGDAVGFLMRNDGLSFPEAVEQLAGLAGMEMPRPEPEERRKYDRLKQLADVLEAATQWFEAQLRSPAGQNALAYLKGRGLDDRAIAEFRLGYAPPASDALRAALTALGHDAADLEEVGLIRKPDDGRAPYSFFRNRAIFPVADKRGRVIAFGGRILEGEGPKYVNSPEHALFHKGSILYGLARARAAISKGERPVVVEGYMDVIAFQRAGVGGAVAPLGTALTEGQLAELWKAQDDKAARDLPPILCFDGDNAGQRAAARAVDRVLPMLGPSRSVAVAFLPRGEDPDSLVRRGGVEEAKRILDGALPLVDTVWQFATSGRALTTPEQRAGLWAELDAQIGVIADRHVQSLYRVELKQRFDALFMPQRLGQTRSGYSAYGQSQFGQSRFSGRRDFKSPFAAPGPRPARVWQASDLEARIFLAMMINHPFLFDELSEIFAEIDIPVAWEPLRQALFDVLSQQTLDAQPLYVQLRSAGYAPILDDVLGPGTTEHASFVKPDMPESKVRAGWRDVWIRAHRRGLDKELAAARADPNRGDDQLLERISKLSERRLDPSGFPDGGFAEDEQGNKGMDPKVLLARAVEKALRSPVKRQRHEDGRPDDMRDFDADPLDRRT